MTDPPTTYPGASQPTLSGPRLPRLVRVAGAVLCLAGAGRCAFDLDMDSPSGFDPRLLDRTCDTYTTCRWSGAVQKTESIASGAVGFRLGPGQASLEIPLTKLGTDPSCSGPASLLVAGHGTGWCGATSFALQTEYRWVSVPVTISGPVGDGGSACWLVIQTRDESVLELADIRSQTFDHVGAGSCSVAAVGAR